MQRAIRSSLRIVFGAMLAALPAAGARADELLVFAAASTRDAMDEIGRLYADAGGRVVFSFSNSGDLARQIERGAPAAVFLSADAQWMDYLAERGLVLSDSRRDLFSNRLVLIAPSGSAMALELAPGAGLAAALGDGKLAMADPDTAPAGRYGKAALTSLGIWDSIERAVVRVKDARAALALVERAEAAAGIVYATDARASHGVRVVAEFPPASHPAIVYPAAIVAGQDGTAARAFAAFLAGPAARDALRRHGFLLGGDDDAD